MAHPKDRSGLSRKELLTGAAAGAVGVGVLGGLAACQNTTTPIGTGESGAGSPLVDAKPVGPGGLPLPRPDNAVTWAITDDNQPIAEGTPVEAGPLQVYNYPDYIYPALVKKFEQLHGTKVEIATYNSADEAIAKLASGQVTFDVVMGLSGSNIVSLIAQQLLAPLNHALLPNLAKNVWTELQDPYYDRGSRYTVPYVVWGDGIGWRNDKVREDIAGMDVPWDIFWKSQGVPGQGRAPRRQARRSQHADAARRDARRAQTGPQHRGSRDRRQGRARPRAADRHLQHQGDDHRLPDPARGQDGAAPLVVG